jgi:hypothetical protein
VGHRNDVPRIDAEERAMTHQDTGKYGKKRSGAELNETIAAKIREKASENRLSCAEAHGIAENLNVAPADVGTAVDLLEVRITKCQLGLFGHGREKNIPELSGKIDPAMESAIKSALVNDRLTCSAAWEISKRFGVPKAMVAAASEVLKIKISACQLGTFK